MLLFVFIKPTDRDFAQLYAVEELCFEPPFRFSRAYDASIDRQPAIRRPGSRRRGPNWPASPLWSWAAVAKGTVAYIQTIEVHPGSRRRASRKNYCDACGRLSARCRRNCDLAACRRRELRRHPPLRDPGYARKGREEHFYARNRAAFDPRQAISSSTEPNREA